MKKSGIVFLFVVLFFQTNVVWGQDDIVKFLEAGVKDAELLSTNYVSPLLKGFGQGLNGGWYNTARTHKSGGVELLISANAVMIPDADQFFTFNNDSYSSVRLDGTGTSAQLPTIFGPAEDGPLLDFLDNNGNESFSEAAPQGIGLKDEIGYNIVPIPTVQLGVGIIKNTDLKIRFFPKTDVPDVGSVSFIGLGVMHDFKQWIPGIKRMPFHLSGLAAFSRLNAEAAVDEGSPAPGSNQKVGFNINAVNVQVIISKKLSVFDFYGALGFNSVSSSLDLKGTYVVGSETLIDPVSLSASASGLRGTAGMRIKLGFFSIYGDYTLSQFNVLNAGIAFSFRENKSDLK